MLPHAIAFANIHIGTIAGKLNGVIPATTPSGCRIEYTSTPRRRLLREAALEQVGTPHANSTFSSPRATSPRASESTLPCSDGDDRRELVAMPVEQVAEGEQDRRPLRERRGAPLPERSGGGFDGRVDLGGRGQIDRRRSAPRWPG